MYNSLVITPNTDYQSYRGNPEIRSIEIMPGSNVPPYAFSQCTSLDKITIHDNVIVKNCAFFNCTNIKTINIKNNVTLGVSSFQNSTAITTLRLGDNCITKSSAFSHSGLQELRAGKSCDFGHMSFFSCLNLLSVKLSSHTIIG
ncbi:leucine-rich repeat domain-containing protein [Candidatus Synchoanobacter obligatus]|uniref:Leucine-rich repeat domain-containing protein n=1 Tax=Candidatus Synchoanobacter obligatus TaxID=2919597 RepID=A0ABT1L3N9_9GAMM|nr:leucine-rich repeat domain-containing protein [Candidatus Synchoanobacter obligatus]MCP8351820.1 leucine-rich repeat domain-containing protein [Candidatus Synchoanobacter obligatus]